MIAVHVGGSVSEAQIVCDSLLAHEIPARVEGARNASIGGQIPLVDASVKVMVAEGDRARAEEVLRHMARRAKLDWVCGCGEHVPGSFESCWRCGAVP